MSDETNHSPLNRQVREFHAHVGQPILPAPQIPPPDRVRLRARLIAEEFFEALEAMFDFDGIDGHYILPDLRERLDHFINESDIAVDLPALADSLADVDYVVEGTRLEFGIDGAPIAAEVHRSNMAKRPGNMRADGKITKPEGWTAPDIAGELRKQGWTP